MVIAWPRIHEVQCTCWLFVDRSDAYAGHWRLFLLSERNDRSFDVWGIEESKLGENLDWEETSESSGKTDYQCIAIRIRLNKSLITRL